MDLIEEFIQTDHKCGEIYIQVEGFFLFNCLSCQQKFTIIEDFQKHFVEHHHIKANQLLLDSSNANSIKTLSHRNKRRKLSSTSSNSSSNFSEYQTHLENQSFQIEPDDSTYMKNDTLLNIVSDDKLKDYLSSADESDDKKNIQPIRGKHEKFSCEICGRNYQNLKAHMKTHKPDCLTCKFCHTILNNKQNLKLHMKLHEEEGFQCSLCPGKFARMSNLTTHLKRHAEPKPVACQNKICEYCGRSFNKTNNLNEHVKRHKNQRDFPCSKCDKKFYNKKLLSEHEVGHSGVKNFVCDICSVRFSRRKNLSSHMKIHSRNKSNPVEISC